MFIFLIFFIFLQFSIYFYPNFTHAQSSMTLFWILTRDPGLSGWLFSMVLHCTVPIRRPLSVLFSSQDCHAVRFRCLSVAQRSEQGRHCRCVLDAAGLVLLYLQAGSRTGWSCAAACTVASSSWHPWTSTLKLRCLHAKQKPWSPFLWSCSYRSMFI